MSEPKIRVFHVNNNGKATEVGCAGPDHNHNGTGKRKDRNNSGDGYSQNPRHVIPDFDGRGDIDAIFDVLGQILGAPLGDGSRKVPVQPEPIHPIQHEVLETMLGQIRPLETMSSVLEPDSDFERMCTIFEDMGVPITIKWKFDEALPPTDPFNFSAIKGSMEPKITLSINKPDLTYWTVSIGTNGYEIYHFSLEGRFLGRESLGGSWIAPGNCS